MYKATRRQTLKLALLAALGASSMTAPEARAADATFMRAALTLDEPGERSGLFLSSSFEFDLPQALSEALHRGIALYFVHEFRLYKERWYWIDKATIRCRFMIRLAFDPLTRRYRLSYNGLSLSFDTLEQALPYIKNIRRWRVGPRTPCAMRRTTRPNCASIWTRTSFPSRCRSSTRAVATGRSPATG